MYEKGKGPQLDPSHQLLREMVDSSGKRYRCVQHRQESTTLAAAPQEEARPTKTPFELLDTLTALCLYRQERMWTYEMCYKKQARQFRQEGAGRSEDFSCGKYKGDDAQVEEVHEDEALTGTPMRFVRHLFAGGANCTLTGQPRTAEVRFTCGRNAHDNIVTAVREFPTCNYVYTVSTPLLCKHPAFRPPPEPVYQVVCEEVGGADASPAEAPAAEPAGADGPPPVPVDIERHRIAVDNEDWVVTVDERAEQPAPGGGEGEARGSQQAEAEPKEEL